MGHLKKLALLSMAFIAVSTSGQAFGQAAPYAEQRAQYQKLYRQGNYKNAYDGFKTISLKSDVSDRFVTNDMRMAFNCLNRLNRVKDIGAYIESVLGAHKKNWRVRWEGAKIYRDVTHYGYIVAGKFHRGYHRGGGRYVYSYERDRTRSMQLMDKAQELSVNETNQKELANFYVYFANVLATGRGSNAAWKLQYLTDLKKLPDFSQNYYYSGGGSTGAPVNIDGTPVYHKMPKSYKVAKTDGERWRWLLLQAKELDTDKRSMIDMQIVNFAWQQFGVQTMRYYGQSFMNTQKSGEAGPFSLHTLKESESIARMASGVQRFTLDPDYDFIKIAKAVYETGTANYKSSAARKLAQIFENRRQYPKAAEYWKKAGDKRRLAQIVEPWCQLNGGAAQVAGKGATINLRFRNGKKVQFTAKAIKLEKLLTDLKAYINSRPKRLDWQKMNLGNIGYRLVYQNQEQYVGQTAASWSLDLNPLAQHFDKSLTVTTPLQKSGAYLLEAKMDNGNTSRVVIWVSNTVMIQKKLDNAEGYFVADARTGAPVAGANIEYFGYRQNWKNNKNGRGYYEINTSSFAEKTNADGWAFPTANDLTRNFSWLAIARWKDRLAYVGFSSVWYSRRSNYEYNRQRVFGISDRPVYRPKHKVNVKFWLRHAKYDKADTSDFAKKTYTVIINNPKGEKIYEKRHETDEFGGLNMDYTLPKDATLGTYNCYIQHMGGYLRFRVEEYKKPEFKVSVEAPTVPVQLGEKITAKIVAKYYFGAPVVKAKVKYKVLRTSKSAQWYPGGYWDWFYGPG
ncbi:MAG: MG2 domain-containing protein, partial [Planctomycetota bacterium]|nr:MG2 domain-containing protein [Planctomycetota bacterium]